MKHLQINRAKDVIINTDGGLINAYHLYILMHEFANIALLREIYRIAIIIHACIELFFAFSGGGGGVRGAVQSFIIIILSC